MPKSSYQLGLEQVLNNPATSFMNNPHVFNEIQNKSGMCTTQMMKYLGKAKKANKPKEPTDSEKSEARLSNLEK